MFGLMLACAFAADTPTINAKTLNPPIKARFIRAPPFRQENATLFIGSINNNKIKEADTRRRRIFRACPGKSSSTPPHSFPARNPAADDFGVPAFVRGGATTFVNKRGAFAGLRSPGPGGGAPASAGSDCRSRGSPQSPPARPSQRSAPCISRACPPAADARQRAPGAVVGLAYAREHGPLPRRSR